MKAAVKLIAINLKSTVRDANAVFWSFVFPALLLLALGLIWGHSATPRLHVGLVGQPDSLVLTQLKQHLETQRYLQVSVGSEAGELRALTRGARQLVLVCPPTGRARRPQITSLRAFYDPQQEASAPLVLASARQAVTQVERQMIRSPKMLRMEEMPIRPLPKSSSAENFMPATIAMMLIQSGLAVALVMVSDRQRGSADIFRVPPVSTAHLVAGNVTTRVLTSGIQAITIILMGVLAFGATVRGSGWVLALLVALGTLTFTSMGAALSMLVRNVESITGLVTLISLPMIFLSGLFFPIAALPKYARLLALALPSSYLCDGLRWAVTGSASITSVTVSIAILTAWTVGCSLFAVKFYRW
jgi:ABC-2 type transport system permease protein